jgi:hypothetical protein
MPKAVSLFAALVGAVALLAVTASPAAAQAATPCWKKVIYDYTDADGVITGHYSRKCLRQAMKHAGEDLKDYTGILDAISALLYDNGSKSGGNGTSSGSTPGSGTTGSAMNPAATAQEQQEQAKEQERKAKLAVPNAGTKGSIPDTSRTIPLPLILLGALGLAALGAATSPPLIRRFRGRFPRFRPAPGSVRPPS